MSEKETLDRQKQITELNAKITRCVETIRTQKGFRAVEAMNYLRKYETQMLRLKPDYKKIVIPKK